MCPKYPPVASMTPRSRKIVASAATSKGAEGAWCGPSLTTSENSSADPMAARPAMKTIPLHPGPETTSWNRFGAAEPIVSAPTRIPMAIPRPARHHPAAILIPGGYTPASATPVTNRSTTASRGRVDGNARRMVATPAVTADAAANRFALQRSLSSSMALKNVPATNPSCTIMVSHAAVAGALPHSAIIPGAATVALNHGVIPRIIATERATSWQGAPGTAPTVTLRQAWLGQPLRGPQAPHARTQRTRRAFGPRWRASRQYPTSRPLSRHHRYVHRAVAVARRLMP